MDVRNIILALAAVIVLLPALFGCVESEPDTEFDSLGLNEECLVLVGEVEGFDREARTVELRLDWESSKAAGVSTLAFDCRFTSLFEGPGPSVGQMIAVSCVGENLDEPSELKKALGAATVDVD
jgi:hypothetical protein